MSPANIRELDEMNYNDKLRHWNRESPWGDENIKFRFNNKIPDNFNVIINKGNIIKMTSLIGRPCFGIVTALLRFGDEKKYIPGRGVVNSSRCGYCKFRTECERVVQKRISASDKISKNYKDWLIARNRIGARKNKSNDIRDSIQWKWLLDALIREPFTNSNDAAVAIYHKNKEDEEREKDRIRKQEARRMGVKAGCLDDVHEQDLMRAMKQRLRRLNNARVDAVRLDKPRTLSRLPMESLRELGGTWYGREYLRLTNQQYGPAAIARYLVRRGWNFDNKKFGALSARVNCDLRRIENFEAMTFEGSPLFPPFDPLTEF